MGSVWAGLLSDCAPSTGAAKLDLDELSRLFPYREPTKKMGGRPGSAGGEAAGNGGGLSVTPEFLSAKRAQNIAICLTKVHPAVPRMSFEAIASAVGSLNPTCELSRDDVAALQLIAPSDEELTSAKEARGKLAAVAEESGDAAAATAAAAMREGERFVFSLLDVPEFDRKLHVINLLMLLPQQTAQLDASICTLHAAAASVRESPTLRRCLALTLRLGNSLNRGTARGAAVGFDVAVLPSLASVKSSADTSYSLLHFVAAALQRDAEEQAAEKEAEAVEVEEVEEADPDERSASPCAPASSDEGGDVAADAKENHGGNYAQGAAAPAAANCAEGTAAPAAALAKVDAVASLLLELEGLPEASEAIEMVGVIESQLLRVRGAMQHVRTELAQLPPKPPPPTLLVGYPMLQPLDDGSCLAYFAVSEVAAVHWVLVPRWRKPPTMSFRGKAHAAPRASDVQRGRCRDGSIAIARGRVAMRVAEQVAIVLIERLPRETELTMYATVEDAFGWLSEAPVAEAEEHGRRAMASWHVEALQLMRAARGEAPGAEADTLSVVDEEGGSVVGTAVSEVGAGDGASECGDGESSPSPSSARGPSPPPTASGDTSSMVVAQSTPALITLGPLPTAIPPEATAAEEQSLAERRAALHVLTQPSLRRQMLVRMAGVASRSGVVCAMTTRPAVSVRSVLGMAVASNPKRRARTAEVEAEAEEEALEADAAEAAARAAPPAVKAGVDGLHARFLLEAFLRDASAEISSVQTRHDDLLRELSAAARFLGLDKGAQRSVSDQLTAISTLRDFCLALSRCANETAAKKAEAAKLEARKLHAATRAARPTLGAVLATTRLACAAKADRATAPAEAPDVREAWAPSPARDYTAGNEYF